MTISETQKKHLRGLGHKLKPLVLIGERRLSDSVFNELEATLSHHELVKVRIRVGDREARDAIIADICSRSDADLIARIGNTALIYRRNQEKPRLLLPR